MSDSPLRVALYSLDDPDFACARLRVLDPVAALGPAVKLRSGVTARDAKLVVDLGLLDWCDIVLMQRWFPGRQMHEAGMIDRILDAGKPIVYEADDDLVSIPEWHGKAAQRDDAEWIARLLPHAALVTVSTEVLRERFAQSAKRVVVLPNYINDALWPLSEPVSAGMQDPHLVYAGTRGHWQDLALIESVLAAALHRHPDLCVTIAGVDRSGLLPHPRVRMMPFSAYSLYSKNLASLSASFAVIPLAEHRFNMPKSAIKFLEFAAVGIPGIFQDMPPYGLVRHEENGLKAGASLDEWSDAIDRLVEDDALRQRLAENANRTVREAHLLSQHASRWLDAWRSVLR